MYALRFACWACCCCGCGTDPPATEHQVEFEEAVNRSNVELVAQLLRKHRRSINVNRRLMFCSDHERAPVNRGKSKRRERYVRERHDGWKYFEAFHVSTEGYEHVAGKHDPSVYDHQESAREQQLRRRLPVAHRTPVRADRLAEAMTAEAEAHPPTWLFVEKTFLTHGTLLHLAVFRGCLPIVQMLLEAGARRSRSGAWIWTAAAKSPSEGTYVVRENRRGNPLALATFAPGQDTDNTALLHEPIPRLLQSWDLYRLAARSTLVKFSGVGAGGGKDRDGGDMSSESTFDFLKYGR